METETCKKEPKANCGTDISNPEKMCNTEEQQKVCLHNYILLSGPRLEGVETRDKHCGLNKIL